MTLIELIERATARLDAAQVGYGHGTTNAFDEAAWLVMWRLGLPLDALDEHERRAISDEERQQADALIEERIATRKPAAYLTRQAWLQGVPFYVDERAIVPRSFIAEVLADGSIDAWLSERTQRVLDLCTGSSSHVALIVAFAARSRWGRAAHIVAVDASALSRQCFDLGQHFARPGARSHFFSQLAERERERERERVSHPSPARMP